MNLFLAIVTFALTVVVSIFCLFGEASMDITGQGKPWLTIFVFATGTLISIGLALKYFVGD